MKKHTSNSWPWMPRNDLKNKPNNIVHHFDKYVTLVEDTFGMLFDAHNNAILVKRFTWVNHNKISVSVITYGARIISMRVPDRGGNVEELVLGFDDLAGYLFYKKFTFGATIGRTTTKLYNSTYIVDGKQYWLKSNTGEHHVRGGELGFDQVNWVPYVQGNVLQLSYVSKDGDDGYPGDLQVRMTFELTTGAEFKISITANTTKITPVDISNIIYINLAGHDTGEEELRNHELLINANCFTSMDEVNEFPTGQIQNVVNTRFNFQVPKLLGEAMGPGPEADYDQNFCVNRGVFQDEAFVARMIHPYKGRVLEIYSNQFGVNFSNCFDFPDGHYNIPTDILSIKPSVTSQDMRDHEALFIVISKLAQYFREKLQLEPEQYHGFIRNLMKKLLVDKSGSTDSESLTSFASELELIDGLSRSGREMYQDFDVLMILKPLEIRFLLAIKQLLPYVTADMSFEMVKEAIDDILEKQNQQNICESSSERSCSFIHKIVSNQIRNIAQKKDSKASSSIVEEQELVADTENPPILSKSIFDNLMEAKAEREKHQMRCGVPIPPYYKKERITGHGGVVYRRFGAFSLRTQCYPNALLMENFPTPILRPNETYRHTLSYKFWILAGDPAKWLRRLNNPCEDRSATL